MDWPFLKLESPSTMSLNNFGSTWLVTHNRLRSMLAKNLKQIKVHWTDKEQTGSMGAQRLETSDPLAKPYPNCRLHFVMISLQWVPYGGVLITRAMLEQLWYRIWAMQREHMCSTLWAANQWYSNCNLRNTLHWEKKQKWTCSVLVQLIGVTYGISDSYF